MRKRVPSKAPASALIFSIVFASPILSGTANAHNESVHQSMTDFAYEVLLAMAKFNENDLTSEQLRGLFTTLEASDLSFGTLYGDASVAVGKLQSLPSGLPDDPTLCLDGSKVDWKLDGGAPGAAPLSELRHAVNTTYANGASICGIDEQWKPSGILDEANTVGDSGHRDHTGVTLGYWAASPDRALQDWVLMSTTLEDLQRPPVLAGVAGGTTVLVGSACAIACGFLPIVCAACPIAAVGSGGIVIDEITSLDASALEHPDFVGLGHFIDMKKTPLGVVFFDEQPGKLMRRAGPTGVPDTVETATRAVLDLAGAHVNHDLSLAPKNYEIILGASGDIGDDFHRNSIARDAADWEDPTIPALQLTAVDNLAMFGWLRFKASNKTPLLGWPLHALGDAAVPMHVVGTSGHGHRPYEDAEELHWRDLLGSDEDATPASEDDDRVLSFRVVRDVAVRTRIWRDFIQNWRAAHASQDVPVRDLVTAVAARARDQATLTPDVYKSDASSRYLLNESTAIAAYDNRAMRDFQRDLAVEGIAATAAFLIFAAEVIE